MKHKPLTLIEGSSEINNGFYEKVNQIIEEERKKNAAVQMHRSDGSDEIKCTF
ncbi:hypothetical protein [Caproiciproducens sp. LBM24188]|nr:hypothetical protein [Clostridiales bacterium]